MSDLLSGLPTLTAPVSIKDERGDHHAVTNAIKWVKVDAVREVLLNPPSEQVNAIIKATERTGKMTASQVCAVLAAAAGGDQ